MRKKSSIICLFFFLAVSLTAFDKPIIKIGSNNYTLFNQYVKETLYPETVNDSVYLSLQKKIFDFLQINYSVGSSYVSYNKLKTDLEKLKLIKFFNYLIFNIDFLEVNKIMLLTRPTLFYDNSNKLEIYNKIGYNFKIKNFKISLYYSNNLYLLNKYDHIYHTGYIACYWMFPQNEALKFKCSFTAIFHHYFDEGKNSTLTPLRKANFTFEVALDLNKLEFKEIFDTIEEEKYNQ